jgi:hypothetical protein
MEMPSPVLIIGDKLLSNKTVVSSKKKYSNYKWVTISAKDETEDSIRAISGQGNIFDEPKVILIRDIPNKKSYRDFILDLVKSSSLKLKFIVWDSENEIQIDPKTKEFNKTWGDFISEFKKNKNHKIVNNGFAFTEKDNVSCCDFIKQKFEKYNKKISSDNALLLSQIVGKDRGMLESEISKLLLTCPDNITSEFIIENAFPSSNEAILYQFGNILDNGSYAESIECLKKFMKYGINENVIADIIVKKARWQLVAAYYWKNDLTWGEVVDAMMQMGKFPSSIWHKQSSSISEKKKQTECFKEIDARYEYMEKICGIKEWQINKLKKTSRAEVIPMSFMAELTVKFLKDHLVDRNSKNYKDNFELKKALINRCTRVYLSVLDKLKEVRYGINPEQDLQDMIILMINPKL